MRLSFLLLIVLASTCVQADHASSQEVVLTLTNGMIIGPGLRGQTGQVDQNAGQSEAMAAKPIVLMDDGLRFTYINQNRVQTISERPIALQKIITGNASERSIGNHQRIGSVQAAIAVSDFDSFGRRVYSLLTPKGQEDVLQGITEVSPAYVRVEGLNAINGYIWDMRLALSAVPPTKLREILLNHADRSQPQSWLDIVTLYQQAKRFREARDLLSLAIEQLPELDNQRPQLRQLDQLAANAMFEEVQTRVRAGQASLAEALLGGFDRDRLANETQLTIDRRLSELQESKKEIERTLAYIKNDIAQLDTQEHKDRANVIFAEIQRSLTIHSRSRFADYLRLRDDKELSPDQRVAMAIGGWLLGSGEIEKNLPVALSAWDARPLVQEYLAASSAAERDSLLDRLSKLEAGVPRMVSRLIANLNPPLPLPAAEAEGKNRFLIQVPSSLEKDEIPTKYWMQLPPEYDPHRRYPCVVSLHGQYAGAKKELEWWVGPYDESFGMCMGEASRNGFIVITPEWSRPKQPYYLYSEGEHARVLKSLRDAMRRTSIDVDRIFISGHQMGGDAAWDMALAHPDLWAGMISIGGDSDKYVIQYVANAKHVPLYFVFGELDGTPSPMKRNGERLDDYLRSPRFDCQLTIYQGRGRDHFQEELPRIVEWMNLSSHRRELPPQEFEVVTARQADRVFWWLESDTLISDAIVNPILFKPGKTKIEAARLAASENGYRISNLPSKSATIWMSPEMVDFGKRITIFFKGKKKSLDVQPSLETLMEDVRTRADRQHPYWAKVTVGQN